MNTITINIEDLARNIVVSFKYNTPEQHQAAIRMMSTLVGEKAYNEACEVAKKMLEE